ncbi:uncharacterized protein YqhQ [Fictibacillus barbaricus]|uniref:Uncharacterized protein YqhQ n=1 Tax=Fictibacillus barbaricus TaxID=182136 RepID=A0ABU1U221_9BACL|nr:uncharacterized protein YqhQ [Fictibacillus barbaricus]
MSMYFQILIVGILIFLSVFLKDKANWRKHLLRLVYFVVCLSIFYFILNVLIDRLLH